MPLAITIEDAYAEACQALGESVVIQRLQATELTAQCAELARLTAPAPEPTEPG